MHAVSVALPQVLFHPDHSHVRNHLPHPQKKCPHGFSPCGRSARPTLSLLAVPLLDGYVMSSVLVPDLHQRLASTTLTGSRLGKILS